MNEEIYGEYKIIPQSLPYWHKAIKSARGTQILRENHRETEIYLTNPRKVVFDNEPEIKIHFMSVLGKPIDYFDEGIYFLTTIPIEDQVLISEELELMFHAIIAFELKADPKSSKIDFIHKITPIEFPASILNPKEKNSDNFYLGYKIRPFPALFPHIE